MPDTDDAPVIDGTAAPRRRFLLLLGSQADQGSELVELVAELGWRTSDGPALRSITRAALAATGYAWDNPPAAGGVGPATPAPGRSDPLERQAARARAELARRPPEAPGGDRPSCWADPAGAFALPFWRSVLGDEALAAVLVVDDPLEAAAAIAERAGVDATVALALHERHERAALEGLAGLPVLVVEPSPGETESSRDWRDEVAAFVAALGGPATASGEGRPATSASEPAPDGPSPGAQRLAKLDDLLLQSRQQLTGLLRRLVGPHECFDPAQPEPESPWVTALLEQRRDLLQVWRGLDWATGRLAGFVPSPTAEAELALDEDEPYPLNATADREAYHRWLERRGEPTSLAGPADLPTERSRVRPSRTPRFSVVVPVYRPPLWALDRCVASILGQDCTDFQLCLCDDASGDVELSARLEEYARLDARVEVVVSTENGGISSATNGALAVARGEFVVFVDNDDELHPSALAKMAEALDAHPEADVLYSDEDKLDDDAERCTPSLKPDWSPDLLLSCAYLCHLLVVRRALVEEVGGLRTAFDGSQDYDLMLRTTELAREVVHVPEILYHWRVLAGSSSGDTTAKPWAYAAGRRALEATLERRQIEGTVELHHRYAGNFHVRRHVPDGVRVSIIMPFRDEPALTANCVRSLLATPGLDDYELLLVDNDSVLPETRALLAELADAPRVRVLDAPGPFDWAKINNDAAEQATGELLLFVNNDIEARSHRWLAAMAGHALRPEVGAVGALLRYPDLTIQHAGVVLGMNYGAAHVQQDLPYGRASYLLLTEITRDCSAVTGACMMTRRQLFEDLGGFDRNLPVAFNDIDYCLRLRERDLLVVYTPLAELLHFESKSRGHADDVLEIPYFYARWRDALLAGDPYYNPHLGRFDPYCRLSTEEDLDRWSIFRSMLEASSTN